MSKAIKGGMVAGLALVAGLCACSKPEKGGESDSFALVPPPPPPMPGFAVFLDVTPQAVARLEETHAKISVQARYYDDQAAVDAHHDLGIETIKIAAADLEPLSPSGTGSAVSTVITGKAFASKVDASSANGTVVTATASASDGSLKCETYRAPLIMARELAHEIKCDLASPPAPSA